MPTFFFLGIPGKELMYFLRALNTYFFFTLLTSQWYNP